MFLFPPADLSPLHKKKGRNTSRGLLYNMHLNNTLLVCLLLCFVLLILFFTKRYQMKTHKNFKVIVLGLFNLWIVLVRLFWYTLPPISPPPQLNYIIIEYTLLSVKSLWKRSLFKQTKQTTSWIAVVACCSSKSFKKVSNVNTLLDEIMFISKQSKPAVSRRQ